MRARLGLGWLLVLAAAGAGAQETKISDEIRRTYDQAVRAASEGDSVKALVLIEGILMVKPVGLRIERSTLPGPEYRYEVGVRQALASWSRLPDSPFYLTDQPDADFTIAFVDQMPNRRHVQGLVQAQRNFRWGKRSREFTISGTITVQRLTRGRMLTSEEVGGVVAHELGHLFGLADVADSNQLMGPFFAGKPRQDPAESELRRVLEFRQFLRDQAERLRPSVEAMLALLPDRTLAVATTSFCKTCAKPHPARRASN